MIGSSVHEAMAAKCARCPFDWDARTPAWSPTRRDTRVEDLTSEFHERAVSAKVDPARPNLDGTRDTGEQFELLLIRE